MDSSDTDLTARQDTHPVRVEVIFLRLEPIPKTGTDHSVLSYRVVQRPLRSGTTPDAAALHCAADAHAAPASTLGGIDVVHSTSWRHSHLGIILTYAALPDPRPELPAAVLHAPSVVCSGDPLQPAPDQLHDHHIAAHAVRHLTYLLDHDPGVAATSHRPHLAPLWTAMRVAASSMPTAPHALAHRSAGRSLNPSKTRSAS